MWMLLHDAYVQWENTLLFFMVHQGSISHYRARVCVRTIESSTREWCTRQSWSWQLISTLTFQLYCAVVSFITKSSPLARPTQLHLMLDEKFQLIKNILFHSFFLSWQFYMSLCSALFFFTSSQYTRKRIERSCEQQQNIRHFFPDLISMLLLLSLRCFCSSRKNLKMMMEVCWYRSRSFE